MSDEMLRATQFFHELTVPLLGRFNTAAELLFSYVVPQLSQSELAIKHQLVALASLQEQSEMTSEISEQLSVVSTSHYQKALRLLADKAHVPDVQVILISCLLSIALENFRSNSDTSFLHLKSGLRVLREWKANYDPHSFSAPEIYENIERYIEPVFAQLETTAEVTGDAGSNDSNHGKELSWARPEMPTAFRDFASAREKFYEIGYWMHILNKQHPLFRVGSPPFIDIQQLFTRWLCAFETYCATVPSQSDFDQIELRTMKACYDLHYITFTCQGYPETEMFWDNYTDKFDELIKTAEAIFDREDVYDSSKYKTRTAFCRDPGILPLCWSVSANCRDPAIRHRALNLMKAHHTRCGDTDDCSAAAISQAIISIEEAGLTVRSCADVPEERRARPLICDLTRKGKMTLTYSRFPYMEPETVTVALRQDLPPPVLPFKLFPLGQSQRLAGYQGLFRPRFLSCRCRSYGIA